MYGLCSGSAASGNGTPWETRPIGSTSVLTWPRAGITPAVSNEVLPTPEGPDNTVSRWVGQSRRSSAASSSLPKNRWPSSVPKGRDPT